MTRSSVGIVAVLGLVLGALLGGLSAITFAGAGRADQAVAVQTYSDRDEAAQGLKVTSEPSPDAPLGLIGGSATGTNDGAAAQATATPTPIGVVPGPTAVAMAPTAAPTVPPPPPTSTPVPEAPPPTVNAASAAADSGVTGEGPTVDIAGDVLPCTDNYVAITQTASNSPDELNAMFDLLASEPQARAADVAVSCSSLGALDQSIYVAYVGPFANAVDACVTAANLGSDVPVVRLSATSDAPVVTCPAVAGFVTHQGQFFVADVPQGATLTDSDRDVGYGYRTRYEGPGYFVTIETSRTDVVQTGASAKESAAGVAATVSGASELRQVMLGGTEVWYFAFTDDGYNKADLFFNLGDHGYAVIGAATASSDVAFGLAAHTVASLQPIG